MQGADLEQFFGAWFHQDWDLDAETWQAVVRQFVEADGPESALAVAKSILLFVQSEPNDADLVARLGCEYLPGDPQHARPWLIALAHELRQVAGS